MDKTFVEEVRKQVEEALGNKEVTVREADKGNGVIYTGLSIRSMGSNIAPTIYFDDDRSIEDTVETILNTYEQNKIDHFDIAFFREYENIKKKLAVMLTSKPIKGLAKRKAPNFDDLYMHAYVVIDGLPTGGVGNIKVKDEHLKIWGITNEQLFKDALKSAPFVMPAKRESLIQTLIDMGTPQFMMPDGGDYIEVLSNKKSVLGAAAILYSKVKENTYMIPSSVHEVLLVDGNSQTAEMDLNAMIDDVNRNVLAPEEYLSNHAYRYNGKKWESIA